MADTEDSKARDVNVKVLSNGKVMKVQKTRQRKILSCIYCHSKKIKCSRVLPTCNNCEKLGFTCQYFANDRISKGGKNKKKDDFEQVSSNSDNSNMDMHKEELTASSSYSHNGDGHGGHGLGGATLGGSDSHNGGDRHGGILGNGTVGDGDGREMELSSNFPNLPKSLLQTPVMNNLSNNITNTYFSNPAAQAEEKEDQYSFNLSSFTFASYPNSYKVLGNGQTNGQTNGQGQSQGQGQGGQNPGHGPLSPTLSNLQTGNIQTGLNLLHSGPGHPGVSSGGPIVPPGGLLGRGPFTHDHPLAPNRAPEIHNLVQPETQSNIISRSNSGTNISSLFAKNPSHLYPQSNIVNFVDSRPASTANFHNVQSDHQISPHYLNSSSFELSNHLDNTKNFLNGTNTYYDNQNLLEDLENHLPTTKEKSYELIERYLNSVHILLPVITNIDDFVNEHDKYWNECNPFDKDSNNSLTDFNLLQFYTLYFPILYAATISEFEEYDNLLLNQDINKYLKGFNKICQYYNYPHGLKIIPLLLGNVIIQSTSPNPSTMEMSQIVRYAKFLQMNKDPVESLQIKDHRIIKFRRLLWWTIFGLDCLTSHNFCLPPVCKFDDFNVQLPNEEEPVFNRQGEMVDTRLSVSTLSLNIKFRYDRILNELVLQLHNENSKSITPEKIKEIKGMINEYFEYIHLSINKMNLFHKKYPPKTMNEINLVNFIKNHSFSFVDRALMLLHKKFLLSEDLEGSGERTGGTGGTGVIDGRGNGAKGAKGAKGASRAKERNGAKDDTFLGVKSNERSNSDSSSRSIESTYSVHLTKPRNGVLSFNQFEDTFQPLAESNMIKNITNFKKLNMSLDLNLNKFNSFSYDDFNHNLVPSILHNLNDFLKYNDFLKFGKYNWYVKRTIPLDSIILLFIIIVTKFKFEMMNFNELLVYVKLINKSLFILNRKWFKNEKYKRMLSLTNLTWEFILKRFRILQLINKFTNANFVISSSSKSKFYNKYQYFNHQLTGYLNTAEIFKTMKVAQPAISGDLINKLNSQQLKLTSVETPRGSPGLEMSALNGFEEQFSFEESPKPKVHFDLDDELITSQISKYSDSTINLVESTEIVEVSEDFNITFKILSQFPVNDLDTNDLVVLKDKISFDLRNNYVDINDYCAFYISLENILRELVNFIE